MNQTTPANKAPWPPNLVIAGSAVVLIFTGVILGTREAFPVLYAFGLFLDLWLFVLALFATCLALYCAGLCCASTPRRLVFVAVVLALLVVESCVFLSPGEPGSKREGAPLGPYVQSALFLLTGTATVGWLHYRRRWGSRCSES
jgi:hypothetical protein